MSYFRRESATFFFSYQVFMKNYDYYALSVIKITTFVD